MQILPGDTSSTQIANDYSNYYRSADQQYSEAFSFANLLKFETVSSSDQNSHLDVLTQDNALTAIIPATSSPTPLADTRVGMEDFAALRQDLVDSGMRKEDILALEQEVNSEEGLTWKQFTARVKEYVLTSRAPSKSEELNNEDQRELIGLFQKLGCTQQESEQLLADLTARKFHKVWPVLTQKLGQLDPNSTTTIRKSELTALCKASGLNEAETAKLTALINNRAKADLNVKELANVLGVAKQETANILKNRDDNLSQLREAIATVMQQAENRDQVEQRADKRDSKNVINARKRMNHEAQSQAEQTGQTKENEQGELAEKPGRADAGKKPEESLTKAEREFLAARKRLEDAQSKLGEESEPEAKEQSGGDKDKDNAWKELWSKVDVKPTQANTARVDTSASILGFDPTSPLAGRTLESANQLPDASRIMRTVQNGILENLGQGRHQLQLRLDPPSLGKMSIIVQVKHNEVSAVIKTENAEVSRIIGDQLAQVKHALEQQGLKVDKLDVQTQLNEDTAGRDWFGTESHNLARDREQQSSLLSSLRKLAFSDADGVEDARVPAEAAQAAVASKSGIDLFA